MRHILKPEFDLFGESTFRFAFDGVKDMEKRYADSHIGKNARYGRLNILKVSYFEKS